MNLVMFMQVSADGTWYSRDHLTVRLAKEARVLVVGSPREVRDVWDDPRQLLRPARVGPGPRGMLSYQPPGWLPEVYRWPRVRRGLRNLRARSLARVLEREGFVPATYYVWQPGYQDTVARLKTQPIVYHCYDKYDRYVGSRAHEMRRQETWLARHAQLCVAASAELGEYLEELGARDVLILRHGVDVDRFRPGLTPADGLSGIPHPRIGVVARFNEGLDIATLEYLARQRPQWSLVLIGGQHFTDGHARERFGRLSALPNVHHVGPQPPNQVPNWLNGLDVALMCYDLAAWGPYNQPIKMYEYLACGLPVVSSNVRAARELETLVTCCDAAEEWVGAIEHALGANSPAAVSCRLAFARANTWDRRASELRSALAPVTRS